MAKERSSNFELLRIVSMIMIVFYHFAFYSGFDYGFISANNIFLNFLELFGKVGANVFILISGYFLINTERIGVGKIAKLWIQIFSYSVLIYFVFVLLGKTEMSGGLLLRRMMPISFDGWWFASAYFLLYIFSPFLNRLLKSLSRRQYLALLATALFFWCVLRTLTVQDVQGNHLLESFLIYSVGGYIKLFLDEKKFSCKKLWITLLITVALDLSVELFLRKISENISFFSEYIPYMRNEMSPFTMVISVCLFLIFKGIKLGNSRFINIAASATFGVYLIHDNDLVRKTLWKGLICGSRLQNTAYFVPYAIAVCLAVYMACTLVELVRIYILEKNYMKLVCRVEPKINTLAGRLTDSIYKKVK